MNGALALALLNTGNYNTPTWTEIDIFKGVKIARSKDKSDTTKRRGKGIKTTRTTTTGITVTGMLEVPAGVTTGNPNWDQYKYFSDAWDADEAMEFMFLDGPYALGSKGVRGFFTITKNDEDQSEETAIYADIELEVADVPFTILTTYPTAKALRKVRFETGSPIYANMGSKVYA